MLTRMIIILLLVLSPVTSYAQETAWKRNLDAGRKATWQDRDKAEPLFLRALTIMEKAGKPEDTFLAMSLQNYASLLRKTDRNAEAEKLEERAKAIWDNQQWGRPQRDR